jgi:hypothetical protein
MSDAFYQQRLARRNRTLGLMGAILGLLACGLGGLAALYSDAATRSLDRSPEAVVRAYVDAISLGDASWAQACWRADAYYVLENGCSETCLQRLLGAELEIVDLQIGAITRTSQWRAEVVVTLQVACLDGATHDGSIVLDGVGVAVPWRHWQIIRSTVGGTAVETWCQAAPF